METQIIFSKLVLNLCICVVCTCPKETCGILVSEFTRESIPMGGQMGMNKKLVVSHELGSLLQTTQSVEAAEEATMEATTKATTETP